MAYLIDGMNLTYKFPDLEGLIYDGELNRARSLLLERLSEFQNIKKATVRIVFDGKKKVSDSTRSEKVGPIQVYYSQDLSADHLIKEFIKKDPNPPMSTVITSDKEILFFVKRFRSKTMTSEEFAAYLTATLDEYRTWKQRREQEEKVINPTLSEEEISFWQELFQKRG